MRIATFNLENLGSRLDRPDDFQYRMSILRPQVERLDADILCLQEVNATRTEPRAARRLVALDRLLEGTDYEGFHRVSSRHPATDAPAEHHNLVILSRWPIADTKQFHHDLVCPSVHVYATADPMRSGAPAIMFDRPILYGRIAPPGLPDLHILNVHFKAPLAASIPGQKLDPLSWKSTGAWAEGFYLAGLKRAGQALEARLVVDRLLDADPRAHILVAGDFNAGEREVPVRIIAADLEDTGNGRLADRMLVPLSHSLSESRRYTVVHRGRKVMLDHLFASRSLVSRFQAIEIHNEALGDELVGYSTVGDSPESYHAPVVARFRPAPASGADTAP